MNPINFD